MALVEASASGGVLHVARTRRANATHAPRGSRVRVGPQSSVAPAPREVRHVDVVAAADQGSPFILALLHLARHVGLTGEDEEVSGLFFGVAKQSQRETEAQEGEQ